MTHPALAAELIQRLKAAMGGDGSGPAAPAPAPAPGANAGPAGPNAGAEPAGPAGPAGPANTPPPPPALSRSRRAAKRAVRKAIAWYVDEVAQAKADQAAARLAADLRQRDEVPALKINQELLKGEVRALLRTVEELGMAIAPATGIEGAAARMSELREGLHALEARLRRLALAAPAAPPTAPAPAHAAPAPAAPPPSLAGFDYAGFERRFRGDPNVILEELRGRYFELLANQAPVLDVGCGRGELLAALGAAGIAASGVDNDAEMVTEALERGVTVHRGDALDHLRAVPEASLGAVVAIQVLEHLPFGAVLELVELARTRLRPGGLFVAETPNPASLVVLGNSYILDPTHVRPLHPSLLAFLCETAGFRDVRLAFWAPAEEYHLKPIVQPGAPAWVEQVNDAFTQLNRVLFGPQDYAVVARTAPG